MEALNVGVLLMVGAVSVQVHTHVYPCGHMKLQVFLEV